MSDYERGYAEAIEAAAKILEEAIRPIELEFDGCGDILTEIVHDMRSLKRPAEQDGGWLPIEEKTPKDRFIFLYCPEDNSRWLAKWQGHRWHGVDELGFTREGMGPEDVTGWKVTHWRELPAAPSPEKAEKQ